MNVLLDIGAFLATARAGSFSAAARELNVATSVVTKRVKRLEDHLNTALFLRSTRRLVLTLDGERLRPRLQLLMGDIEDTLSGIEPQDASATGSLRIKVPTTLASSYFGDLCAAFQVLHPRVKIEIVLIDRSVNPLEEGFDVAIGALPQSYAYVLDHPLCPYPRVLCAAPGYFDTRKRPRSPNDLVDHECIVFHPAGATWTFQMAKGTREVDVTSNFVANDSRILLSAVRQKLGIAILPRFIVGQEIDSGGLEELLPEFPVEPLWIKALVPRIKMKKFHVAQFVQFLQATLEAGLPVK